MWALQVTDGLPHKRLAALLKHEDEYVRAWAVQFLCDASSVNAFQPPAKVETGRSARPTSESPVEQSVLDQFASMAKNDESLIVRLYLASAVQRLPYADRWPILTGLISHPEDIADNNLPRMYWFGLEPMVPAYPKESLELVVSGKIPALQEFVARRMVTGNAPGAAVTSSDSMQQQPAWQWTILKVAPGFRVLNVGERGVVHHDVFRNAVAVQTHPLDRKTPSSLVRDLTVPREKKTKLTMRVSHHPHGDWQLRVRANGSSITDQIVSSKTVSKDEWLEVTVDLSRYAGQRINLAVEDFPNNWQNEWAYWNRVSIVSE
jgi:hypothetical protein